jgi:TPR repeat protein
MLNITNATSQMMWVALAVMAATGEASAQTTLAVIAKYSIPYSASPQDVFSKAPLGQFEFNMHLCVRKEMPIFGHMHYLQFILPSGESVYSELRYREAITSDPAGDEGCESIGAQAPTQPKGMNQRTGDAVAATGTASAQTSGKMPNGGDAGSLQDGLAAEKRGDWKAAYLLLWPLAVDGNAEAANQLGFMYETGKCAKSSIAADPKTGCDHGLGPTATDRERRENRENAGAWYRLAASKGNAHAETQVGMSREAADQGNAEGQFQLGIKYYFGQGVPKDYAEAMKWYRKAADQGNADAQNATGVMYNNGEGVPTNDTEAVKWYRKAADQGNADAQENIKRLEQNAIIKSKLATRKEIGDTVCSCTWPVPAIALSPAPKQPQSEPIGKQNPLLQQLLKDLGSPCRVYGQVENVHNDKIEVRVHFHENGKVVPSIGSLPGWSTPGRDYDQLNWIGSHDVIKCESE